jgi:hypothetical protein
MSRRSFDKIKVASGFRKCARQQLHQRAKSFVQCGSRVMSRTIAIVDLNRMRLVVTVKRLRGDQQL